MKLRAIPGSLDLQQMNKNNVVDIEFLKFICTGLSSWGEEIGRERQIIFEDALYTINTDPSLQ